MSVVGYSTLDVIPSMKNLRSQIEAQSSAPMVAAGKSGGRKYGEAAGREGGAAFRSKMGASLKGFAPFAGVLAGAGLVQGFDAVVGAASDAQQSVGGVQAVFKEYADQVVKDSARAEQALGLSETAYQELITVTSALLKNKGLEDFAEQGKNLLEIGADLAATYGGPTRQAVEALNAAMRGESDPIERYAISLNETAVKAELVAKGQDKLTGAALEQAKAQARLALITQQSADAAGAFGRELNTQEGQAQRTAAQWANMRVELGEKLLPATQAFTGFLNSQGLPAIEAAGGVVADAAGAFADLPGPVKAATAALVAFRLAQAAGVGTGISGALSATSSGLDSLRLRAMLAADSYRSLRAGQLEVINNSGKFTPAVGRMSASLGALQSAGLGAGAGLKRGLSSALSLVGGPWGVAFIAGTALVAKFWSEHQKAKARVEELTESLDKQTGALTANSREIVIKELADSKALAAAERLGVSLELVTNAALGQKDAYASLSAQLRSRGQLDDEAAADAIKVKQAIDGTNDTIRQAASNQRLMAAAQGSAATTANSAASATSSLTSATGEYADGLSAARTELQKLMDKEAERSGKALGAFQDQTRLAQALRDARKEAEEGGRTLDENREAGLANRDSLAALADAWNSSAESVKNAKGAYRDMRQNFIDVADEMGASREEARRLADELLGVPKKAGIEFQSKGFKERMAEIRELRRAAKALADQLITLQFQRGENKPTPGRDKFATGGMIGGTGTGTSDSNLIWASRGEFMQRKAAVDYYGADFMRRLNALQIPKYASGGPIGAVQTVATPVGQEIAGTLRIVDGVAYIEGVARGVAERDAKSRRLSSSDGIRR